MELVEDNFVLVVDWTNDIMYQVNLLQPDQIAAFPSPLDGTFIGILYNPLDKKVYWTEYYDSKIYSAKLDGSDFNTLVDIGKCLGRVQETEIIIYDLLFDVSMQLGWHK